jgi:nucleoside-diphosphate-sugar epimerase
MNWHGATMNWAGVRCLVTGGSGFGGRHLVETLLDRGALVTSLDLVGRPDADRETIQSVIGDVRNFDLVSALMARSSIEVVFHLAAQPLVPVSVSLPLETLDTNAMGTYVVLEACRRVGVDAMVLASSGAYYGSTSVTEPIEETFSPLPAANLYASSKAAADLALQGYVQTFDLPAGACRFMNTYGPGDTNLSRLIPRALDNLRHDRPYHFGDRDDGTSELDFLFVGDMVAAYMALAEWLMVGRDVNGHDRSINPVFNIGTGVATPISAVARLASIAFDGEARVPIFHGSTKTRAVRKLLSATKAGEVLGWHASTTLDQGLALTMKSRRSVHP